MSLHGLFIAGTDTGVGKTFISAALMAACDSTLYWKPLQTGPVSDHDTPWVRERAELPSHRVIDRGYRFAEPASPHHAAALEGATIDLDWLCSIASGPEATDAPWLVEGVGGLMVPIDDNHLLPELINRLALPVLVVASTRLGGINHSLLTLAQLATLNLPTLGIVLNGPRDPSIETALRAHSNIPIVGQIDETDSVSLESLRDVGKKLLHSPLIAEVLT